MQNETLEIGRSYRVEVQGEPQCSDGDPEYVCSVYVEREPLFVRPRCKIRFPSAPFIFPIRANGPSLVRHEDRSRWHRNPFKALQGIQRESVP